MAPDISPDKLLFSQVRGLLKSVTGGKDFPSELMILKSVLEETREGIIVAGGDGRFLYMNAAMRRIHGQEDFSGLDPLKWAETFGLYKMDGASLYDSKDLPLARVLRGETVEDQKLFVRNPQTPQGALLSARGLPLKDEK
ncbi:MAG TPA: PAS domain-containing protein, partial [bacterium]|nr:PAS domain-containing protein [bacterium]